MDCAHLRHGFVFPIESERGSNVKTTWLFSFGKVGRYIFSFKRHDRHVPLVFDDDARCVNHFRTFHLRTSFFISILSVNLCVCFS